MSTTASSDSIRRWITFNTGTNSLCYAVLEISYSAICQRLLVSILPYENQATVGHKMKARAKHFP